MNVFTYCESQHSETVEYIGNIRGSSPRRSPRRIYNVVTAIFVENTIEQAHNDREYMVQTEMRAKKKFLIQMQRIFDELDSDASGTIGINELEEHMSSIRKLLSNPPKWTT